MFCDLKWLIRPFIVILLISGVGCSKETSYELPTTSTGGTDTPGGTSGGTAEYALTSCADAGIAGTYKVGTALGTDAKISIKVNVTKAGDWSLTTGVVNGMVFIGGGTFSATGSQTITLQGTGAPTTAGTNTISYKIGTTSCSVDVTTTGSDNTGSSSDYYYSITIDGKVYTQKVTMDNDWEAGSSMSSSGDDAEINASINYGYDNPPAGSTSFGITIGTMHNYSVASDDDFKAFMKVGTRSYTQNFRVADGVQIGWKDANGVYWGTDYGSGDQTGSTFEIVSIEDARDITRTLYLKTKITFKCKLYNQTTGEVKTVTSGEMVGSFGKI